MEYNIPSFWIALVVLLMLIPIVHYRSNSHTLQHIVNDQNETIQRLINREPGTYAETGQKPNKPAKEAYAAWGNQVVNIDEDERQ
jgi:hypothetical protein